MEQRIGSSSPPVPAAGVDPAYVPGLTPPPVAEAPSADAQPKADISPEEPEIEPAAVAAPVAEPEVDAEAEAESADAEADGAEGEEEFDDDPLFEATDRRGAIIADRHGITFRLDDQQAEFLWDEIGAVEVDTPRFGRRFSVTVYISARRWFQSDVEAPTRAILKEWAYDLDKVLDAHFEEPTVEDEDPALDTTDEDDAFADEGEDAKASEAETEEATETEDEDSTAEAAGTKAAADADPAPEDTKTKPPAEAKSKA